MTDGDTHKVALSKEPECGAWIVQKGERKTAYVGHSMNDVLILACNLETKNKLDSLDTNTAKIIALQCEVNAKTQIIHDLIIERKDTKNLFVVGILSGIVIAGVGVALASITPILLGVVLAATAFGGIWGIRKDGR